MQLMEALIARYDTLNTIELARFSELLATHLRAIRPEFISFSFRSGVKRRQKLALGRIRQPVVAERQLQGRVRAVARVAGSATLVSARTQYQSVVIILFAAQTKVGVSIFLTSGLLQLSPRSQAFFMTKHCLSFATWSALRKSYGGNTSGFSSREVVQSAARTIAEEPGRQTWTDDRGAHLVSLRDALECLLAELTSSGQFRERLVRGQDGQSVPRTSPHRPTPELP